VRRAWSRRYHSLFSELGRGVSTTGAVRAPGWPSLGCHPGHGHACRPAVVRRLVAVDAQPGVPDLARVHHVVDHLAEGRVRGGVGPLVVAPDGEAHDVAGLVDDGPAPDHGVHRRVDRQHAVQGRKALVSPIDPRRGGRHVARVEHQASVVVDADGQRRLAVDVGGRDLGQLGLGVALAREVHQREPGEGVRGDGRPGQQAAVAQRDRNLAPLADHGGGRQDQPVVPDDDPRAPDRAPVDPDHAGSQPSGQIDVGRVGLVGVRDRVVRRHARLGLDGRHHGLGDGTGLAGLVTEAQRDDAHASAHQADTCRRDRDGTPAAVRRGCFWGASTLGT
jgi:hypothetical protein